MRPFTHPVARGPAFECATTHTPSHGAVTRTNRSGVAHRDVDGGPDYQTARTADRVYIREGARSANGYRRRRELRFRGLSHYPPQLCFDTHTTDHDRQETKRERKLPDTVTRKDSPSRNGGSHPSSLRRRLRNRVVALKTEVFEKPLGVTVFPANTFRAQYTSFELVACDT